MTEKAGLFLSALCLVLMGLFIKMAYKQHKMNATFKPVDAVVLSADIKIFTDKESGSETYEPVIHYQYSVQGATYTCREIFPMSIKNDHRLTPDIRAIFKEGVKTTAFYNPDNHAEAFLIKDYLFFPYGGIMAWMFFIMVGLIGAASSGYPRKPKAPKKTDVLRFEIAPRSGLAESRRTWLILTAVWLAVGALTAGHYFYYASPPHGAGPYVISFCYAACSFFGFSIVFRSFELGKYVRDARVYTDKGTFILGDEIKVEVSQRFKKPVSVKKVLFGLMADKVENKKDNEAVVSTETDVSAEHEDIITVMENRKFAGGEEMSFSCTVKIPAYKPPSSAEKTKQPPFYHWWFEVRTEFSDQPAYIEKYPVFVIADPTV